MREWLFKPGDPLSLTLAADARLGPTDYVDDQIWELQVGGGEPSALALQTTFGLRASALRLFPRFSEGELMQTDPAAFVQLPVITRLFPNFLTLTFSPFRAIDVEAEYWVPQSQAVAGRLQVTNSGGTARRVRLEWVGQLASSSGQRMAPLEIQAAPVLSGFTDGLAPVVFLTGGPQSGAGSYPALALDLDLEPGAVRQVTWVHAALSSPDESFALARSIAARKWEAERARLELLNAGQVEVYTGDSNWDAAFSLAQKAAFGLFAGPTSHLRFPSLVLARQPDQGFSRRGDGTDYNYLWNGQAPIDAAYLAGLVLPGAPYLAQGLLRNFIDIKAEDGFIDWKPGLARQRSQLLATPVLANLAWEIYETTEDQAFIEEVFPALLSFLNAWFTPLRDRDGDGIPEWDHLMQSGIEDHPVFSRWTPWAQGVEINSAESPALCSFLYRECQVLLRMANLLDRREPVAVLQSLADHLKVAVETSWDPEDSSYHYWDRDTHHISRGEWLGERRGPGEILLERAFEFPARLLVKIQTDGESSRRPEVFVHGTGASGHHRIEHLTDEHFKWYLGRGNLTGERVYNVVEKIELRGLDLRDQVSVYSVGYQCEDLTLLLPLWASLPEPERARELVERTVTNSSRYWRPFGLPAFPEIPEAAAGMEQDTSINVCQAVHMPWNTLIGEGLISYGFRREAAELVTRLMEGVIRTLKREAAFRRYYHAGTGQGFGERNALNGLAPLSLFLKTLGLRLISPQRVALNGFNPFPWPVTVKFRGMTVLLQRDKTVVIFADGQTVVVNDPAPRIVSLLKEPG